MALGPRGRTCFAWCWSMDCGRRCWAWASAWRQRSGGAAHSHHALRHQAAGSVGVCRGGGHPAGGCRDGLHGAGVARFPPRSHAGAADGVEAEGVGSPTLSPEKRRQDGARCVCEDAFLLRAQLRQTGRGRWCSSRALGLFDCGYSLVLPVSPMSQNRDMGHPVFECLIPNASVPWSLNPCSFVPALLRHRLDRRLGRFQMRRVGRDGRLLRIRGDRWRGREARSLLDAHVADVGAQVDLGLRRSRSVKATRLAFPFGQGHRVVGHDVAVVGVAR